MAVTGKLLTNEQAASQSGLPYLVSKHKDVVAKKHSSERFRTSAQKPIDDIMLAISIFYTIIL